MAMMGKPIEGVQVAAQAAVAASKKRAKKPKGPIDSQPEHIPALRAQIDQGLGRYAPDDIGAQRANDWLQQVYKHPAVTANPSLQSYISTAYGTRFRKTKFPKFSVIK
jgi:hypothetical protein